MTNNGRSQPELEELWKFAGQGLRASDFNSAMVHFYRGEVTRANMWRQRLDITTNWAVIVTGAALTFTFSDPDHTHAILLINTLLILLFLFMEARRYRYYELWTYRVRLMETNFYAGLLSPPFLPSSDWAERITDSLRNPRFPISLMEAFGRRYRRNYAPIFLILAISWIGKVYSRPDSADSILDFVQRAQIGPIPGVLVLAAGILFNGALIAIGLFTTGLRQSPGEVFAKPSNRFERLMTRFRHATWEALETDIPPLRRVEGSKQLAYVISDSAEEIGKALMQNLGRGVTLWNGTGLYSGGDHPILMCAMTEGQADQLRAVTARIDPNAFVVVTPVDDVRGHGFRPLEA
jgi:uncharacterized membrane protein